MAKIYKITGYLVDPNGDWSEDDITTEIENLDLIHHHIKCDVADIGEFQDDSVLNRCDCPVEECEKYFSSNVCNNNTVPAFKSEALCRTCVVTQQCDTFKSCTSGCSRFTGEPYYRCKCVDIQNGTICTDYKHI